jgi:hypothetical protein
MNEKQEERTFKQTLTDAIFQKLGKHGNSRSINIPHAPLNSIPEWKRAIDHEKATHQPILVNLTFTRENGKSYIVIELQKENRQ